MFIILIYYCFINIYNTLYFNNFYSLWYRQQIRQSLIKEASKETLLTPRFYTTDFKEISELDISSNLDEIEAIVEEFKIDYNRDHFIRDKEFSIVGIHSMNQQKIFLLSF